MKDSPLISDILIIHYNNTPIAEWIQKLTKSVGLRVLAPVDASTFDGDKTARTSMLGGVRLVLVLHAFDASLEKLAPGSELRLDQWKTSGKTRVRRIQIVESRDKKADREQAGDRIVFARTKLEMLAIDLLRNLKDAGLVQPGKAKVTERMSMGKLFNAFLDRMDDIWDNEFDQADLLIPSSDGRAERDFTAQLDDFFLCYWRAIRELAGNTAKPKRLSKIFDQEYAKAREHACHAWEIAAVANQRYAEQQNGPKAAGFREAFDAAITLIKQAKLAKRDRGANLTRSMALYKEAAQKLHQITA
jgi:hypothetical protein